MEAYGGRAPETFSDPVPDMVKQFVVYLYRHIRERNIREIFSMYDVSFAKLSERFFKTTSWPPVHMIADLVDGDHVFCLLYKEMYFRHLYATTQPTLEQRCESWDNYVNLFRVLLQSHVNMQLPNGWLWDMVDEFIYQFQSFAQYRGKLAQKSPHELELLKKCDGVWDLQGVLHYLQGLIDKSGVVRELASDDAQRRFCETEGYEGHSSNVLRTMGYFSLIGLLRVHCLLGEYETALKALGPIQPFKSGNLLTPKVAGANIALYYYTGFSYLMLQRYLDAARAFNIILNYINRVKAYHQRSAQYDQILKKNEQMYALLAVTTSLCPASQRNIDESVANTLKEKYNEKMQRIQRGLEGVVDELFTYSCPKFVAATPPRLDNLTVNSNQEAYRQQFRGFMSFVDQQRQLPVLKQFLKLYTTISLPKLAGLMDTDEAAVKEQLRVLEGTSQCKTWSGQGDAAAGSMQSAADVEVSVSKDADSGAELISVEEVNAPRSKGNEFILRHITKFQEIVRDLNSPALTGTARTAGVAAY